MTLKLDPSNARSHDERNKAMIADSLAEFGAIRPIVIGSDDVIYAGNATYEEAIEQGKEIEIIETDGSKLYAIRATHLDEQQLRDYGLVDNRSTELSTWDTDELRRRLESDESESIEALWEANELSRLLYPDEYLDGEGPHGQSESGESDDGVPANPYSDKLGTLLYEPQGEQPAIESLTKTDKRDELVARIEDADIDAELRDFLIVAASRHVVFDYGKIANYYAHAEPEVQELIEESALVIIDSDRAIELGYLKVKAVIDDVADDAFAIRNGVEIDD